MRRRANRMGLALGATLGPLGVLIVSLLKEDLGLLGAVGVMLVVSAVIGAIVGRALRPWIAGPDRRGSS